jgi:hypothetical protein
MVSRQVYARPFLVPLRVVVWGEPTVIRKPYYFSVLKSDGGVVAYWWKGGNVVLEVGAIEVFLSIVDGHATSDICCILTFITYESQLLASDILV